MTRYRLRVSLVGSDPEIWRELEVHGGVRLRMLHLALQIAMGWRESHLHEFTDADPHVPPVAPPRRWGPPEFPDTPADTISEDDATVADALRGGGPLWYEYDFGDRWTHRIDVLDERADEPELTSVVVLDGALRAPFEDSGGLRGYAEKLAIAGDPTHPEHDDIAEWIHATVGPWAPQDASTFDVIAVQTELNLLFNTDESGFDPYDMSGLVKREELRRPGDVHDASPIVTLAAELPP
ncbi:MAG TPA: plasmid pRiA4b ORF-3 family protein, partial [Microbacterium sp.]|nr:plasmid pRiA4b ORF-3 family protein [Microbacterium sp.]